MAGLPRAAGLSLFKGLLASLQPLPLLRIFIVSATVRKKVKNMVLLQGAVILSGVAFHYNWIRRLKNSIFSTMITGVTEDGTDSWLNSIDSLADLLIFLGGVLPLYLLSLVLSAIWTAEIGRKIEEHKAVITAQRRSHGQAVEGGGGRGGVTAGASKKSSSEGSRQRQSSSSKQRQEESSSVKGAVSNLLDLPSYALSSPLQEGRGGGSSSSTSSRPPPPPRPVTPAVSVSPFALASAAFYRALLTVLLNVAIVLIDLFPFIGRPSAVVLSAMLFSWTSYSAVWTSGIAPEEHAGGSLGAADVGAGGQVQGPVTDATASSSLAAGGSIAAFTQAFHARPAAALTLHLKEMEQHFFFYLGFGLPSALLSFFPNALINGAVYATLVPILTIMAAANAHAALLLPPLPVPFLLPFKWAMHKALQQVLQLWQWLQSRRREQRAGNQ